MTAFSFLLFSLWKSIAVFLTHSCSWSSSLLDAGRGDQLIYMLVAEFNSFKAPLRLCWLS